jgi:rubrerythrin
MARYEFGLLCKGRAERARTDDGYHVPAGTATVQGARNKEDLSMSIVFNADEIFALAERIEENGEAFYRAAAKKVEGDFSGLLFELADWESRHRELFSSWREDLSESDREATAFDPLDESSLYLNAMADGFVFDPEEDPLAELGPEPGMDAILRAALQREKDAIAFFSGVREMVPERLGQDKIVNIIKEEMRHVTILNKQLASLGR